MGQHFIKCKNFTRGWVFTRNWTCRPGRTLWNQIWLSLLGWNMANVQETKMDNKRCEQIPIDPFMFPPGPACKGLGYWHRVGSISSKFVRFFNGISLRKSLPIENLDKYPLVSGPHQIFNEGNSGGFDNNPLLRISRQQFYTIMRFHDMYLVRPE